jgi:arsenate reductase
MSVLAGPPLSAHWGFEDPAALVGTDDEKRAAFHRIFRQIMTRINVFLSLPMHMVEKNAIQRVIQTIGTTPA